MKRTMKESQIIYHIQKAESDEDEFVDFSTRVRHDEDLTLADFKTISRRSDCRYFFLAVDPEFGLIKTSIDSNNEILPSFNGIIEAWLFEDEKKQYNKIFTEKLKSLSSSSKKSPSWKRLLDLKEDFEATHQRKNQRYSDLELSTCSSNGSAIARKQHKPRGYLETSFFTAEPIEIVRENNPYSTSSTRKPYPISSSPIKNFNNHGKVECSPEQSSGNVSSAPEFWTIRSETQKIFLDGTCLSDIDRSNKSTSKSCGSFSRSGFQSFGTANGASGRRSPPEQGRSPYKVLLELADAHNNGSYIKGKTGSRFRHEDAIFTRAQDLHDIYTGTCKPKSTKPLLATDTYRLDHHHDSSAGSYVDLAPPSGKSSSKEESRSDLIASDMKYPSNPSIQNKFENKPCNERPLNNSEESGTSLENRFLVNQKKYPEETHEKPKIRRPLQYIYEPEVLHSDVADLHDVRQGGNTRVNSMPRENSPTKPPRTFEYIQPDSILNQRNPFRETGTNSIQIGNLTSKSKSSCSVRDGLSKSHKITNNHRATRVCSQCSHKNKEHHKRKTLPDVCLSLFDVSKMSRDKFQGMRPERSTIAPTTFTLDKYGYQTCLQHRSITSFKNLSNPGQIPSSCLSLCNFNMNRSSRSPSVCGSSRHFVNTERKGYGAESLVSVEPNIEISEQIENLTSDCEVCKLNDKNADDVISDSVLSLYDFKMADIKFGGKTTSAKDLSKASPMTCCRSQ